MNLFKKEKDEQFKSIKLKSLRKTLSITPQVGRTTKSRDIVIKALPAGKRISKTGNVYYETRANRSDKPGTRL